MQEHLKLFYFIIFLISSFLMTICLAAPQAPIPVGRVVWIKGSLKAEMENKEVRLLQNKSIIYLHDMLVTDGNSKAEIGFTDQTLMTFRENTRFKVDKYQYTPKSKSAPNKSVMNLIEGGFRTITGAIAKNTPNNYDINTPVATIGVRGTDYQVFVQGVTTYLGFYSGTPCISTPSTCKVNRTVCLSSAVQWAKAVGPCGIPQPLTEKPDVFKNDLEVTPASIAPFNTSSSNGGGRNKPTNDFCIE